MREIEPIPVIRAAYLNLFIDVLKESGRHYKTALQQSNLPTRLADKRDDYVPLKAALSFLHWAVCSTGIEDLGLRAGLRLRISDFDATLRSALLRTPMLESALQTFCRLADREQSPISYRMVRGQDEVRIYSSFDALRPYETDHCGEWLQIMPLLTIFRHFAGEDWTPTAIAFQSQHAPEQHARRAFPRTRFLVGQKETGIVFPASLLRLASTTHEQRHRAAVTPGIDSCAPRQVTWDFPTSLRELLQAYLDEGYPDIHLAAKIAGSSVRTLQRKLSQYHLSYSDLLQQTRFDTAMQILKDPSVKMIDAAYALGYEDPSSFSRAFRRIAGVSPREYRRQHLH